MQITTEQIKALRDETGVSVMQCKKALEEAGGDIETARMVLKKKSSEIAAKKSDREAHMGILVGLKDDTKGVLFELNCETDFVAKNQDFITLAQELAKISLAEGKEVLLNKAEELISPVVQKIGENIKVGTISEVVGSPLSFYVHDGKIATIVALVGGSESLAKDLAMHITAMNPEYTVRADITEEVRNRAHEMFQKEVNESDKPEEIKTKMLQGKIDTFFKEQTLMEQPFFKDPSKTIEQLLTEQNAQLSKFIRTALG